MTVHLFKMMPCITGILHTLQTHLILLQFQKSPSFQVMSDRQWNSVSISRLLNVLMLD